MATCSAKISTGSDFDATVIAQGAGRLWGSTLAYNANAAVSYVKFYDKATVPDPSGGDTPIARMLIPAGGTAVLNVSPTFIAGLAYVMVTGAADTDENAVAANEIGLNIEYDISS